MRVFIQQVWPNGRHLVSTISKPDKMVRNSDTIQNPHFFKRIWTFVFFYSAIFPVADILAFQPPGLGSYSMRAAASYSYEGLVAASSFEPAVNCDGIINCTSHLQIRSSYISILLEAFMYCNCTCLRIAVVFEDCKATALTTQPP